MLSGRVCVVTGASRGIGRGVALQLGEAGALVYITGRSSKDLSSTSDEIKARGGQAIPVIMDHSNDEHVENLFKRIDKEQNGKLDVLVNNAYAGVRTIVEDTGIPFYEKDPAETWDIINNVGLRNHFLCTTFASRLMVPRRQGLIVNISSPGGLVYLFNVAYGVGKAALDRMSADCGHELKRHNVTCMSLWPGAVKTEMVKEHILGSTDPRAQKGKAIFEEGESVEFAGKAIVHLAADPNVHRKTGKIQLCADAAREYGFVDEDGTIPGDIRSLSRLLKSSGWVTLAPWVPSWIRIPPWMLHLASNKF